MLWWPAGLVQLKEMLITSKTREIIAQKLLRREGK